MPSSTCHRHLALLGGVISYPINKYYFQFIIVLGFIACPDIYWVFFLGVMIADPDTC